MDKVTIIPRESKSSEIFSKNVRDTDSSDFFVEHIFATREYMKINGIPVSGKRYTDIGNVLLKGSVVMEESVIDALYMPGCLDERQHDLLLFYLDEIETKNKMVAVHTIYKDNDYKYKFNAFSVTSNEDYEKLRMMIGLKYLTYAVNNGNKENNIKTSK